jgi:dinuclear metal center YbgI/SA1388 family protein
MRLCDIVTYLDEFLDLHTIQDSCKNGLEVEGRDEVTTVGFAVDACLESFQKAGSADCDMVIVHHGLFWGDLGHITDILYTRLKYLMDHEIALYASHLPLDVHPVVGNNVQLAQLLDLSVERSFCPYNGTEIGLLCTGDTSFDDLLRRAREYFPVRYLRVTDTAEKVGIITGSGGRGIPDAVRAGCDTFITGEVQYQDYRSIAEQGINVICGGHYQTEVYGLKALMAHLQERFDLTCEFLDLKEIRWRTER